MMRKKMIVLGITSFLSYASASGQDKNYYLSETGNDNNDGHSEKTAWQTLSKLNSINFRAGDSIFFEGGHKFVGPLKLNSTDYGSVHKPVVFLSRGEQKAIIEAGKGDGIHSNSSSFITITGLSIRGNGVLENEGSGIHFYSNDAVAAPENIRITNCDISGFRHSGIVFGCNEDLAVKGYRNVSITHCEVSKNGNAGISSYGSQNGFQHRDFYIAWCKVFRNDGIPFKKQGHSGNGIVMAQVNGILIEYCEAFENGKDNQSTEGGPVGIWVWMCKNGIIQHCVSHHNRAGFTKDGGGFDIDGGSSNCILQYNYSYNNEGAGYLLAEFGALFPFTENIIRFNVSVNDGRKNGYGAITVWGAAQQYRVTNTQVYNNTIYLDDRNVVNGRPSAINLMGPHFSNVVIANNLIVTRGNVDFVTSDTIVSTQDAILLHNNYYSYTGNYQFTWEKKKYNSLQSWLKSATSQETINEKGTALSFDPQFKNRKEIENFASEKAKTLKPWDFTPSKTSALIQNKFRIGNFPEMYSTTKDYCNQYVPSDGEFIPGACTNPQ